MKWVLIAIVLSGWDGSPKSHVAIAEYNNFQQCEKDRERLDKRSNPTKYVCANNYADEKYIVVKEGAK